MSGGARRKRPGGRLGSTKSGLEWVGGRVPSPFYITEGTPYRPEMILWLEMPDFIAVSFHLCKPSEPPGSFGESLLEAINAPLAGPPRCPDTIRVASPQLAKEVRRILPDVGVVQAPTPEVQRALELMSKTASQDRNAGGEGEDPSYFEAGRVGGEAVEALFRAAEVLYHVAPWKVATDDQILRVDIPKYNVEGACLSIIGNLGQSFGLILFPSLQGYERFSDAADEKRLPGAPIDLGSATLALTFEAGSDLPPSMHREALEHGWPVAGARAYPLVENRDPDAIVRPLTERDVRIVSACALSLASFFAKHRKIFKRDAYGEPICESYFDDDDLEVRFTLPHEAWSMFEVNAPPRSSGAGVRGSGSASVSRSSRKPVGRNDPCPCGSGKKYKHCCLRREETGSNREREATTTASTPAAWHELDHALARRMARYARDRFGPEWMSVAASALGNSKQLEGLLADWALHHQPLDGKPISQRFLEEEIRRLSHDEVAWLVAQRVSWLSVWEVVAVEPGRGLTLKDLLTDQTRQVVETSASQTMVKRDAMLARVVDYQGASVLCGVHGRSLPPRDAAMVVERARRRLRRKTSIPVERMREEAIGRYLIDQWEEAVEEAEIRASVLPTLQNTDGESLLLTTDHFGFDVSDQEKIVQRLAAIEGVEAPSETDGPDAPYVFSKPGKLAGGDGGQTIIATAKISGGTLRIETNSLERANSVRAVLESSLGALIRHRAREHTDPIASMRTRKGQDGGSSRERPMPSLPPGETGRIIQDWKEGHYSSWVDEPLPALGGESPRRTARTKSGREMLSVLLKEMENGEARQPEGQRFDFSRIRRLLGLEE